MHLTTEVENLPCRAKFTRDSVIGSVLHGVKPTITRAARTLTYVFYSWCIK